MSLRALLGAVPAVMIAFSFAIAPAHAAKKDAGAPKARLPKKDCKRFFNEIMLERNGELVIVPYIERRLRYIYSVLNAPHASEKKLVQAIVDEDIRKSAYLLESMAKTLRSLDPVSYKALLAEFEIVENETGDYLFTTEMLELLRTDEYLKPYLTPRIEAYFKGRVIEARDNMLKNLERSGWLGEEPRAYGRIFDIIEESEPIWKKSKLKKQFAKTWSKRLRGLHAALKNGDYNPEKVGIEGGTHKARRLLRLFAQASAGFDGLLVLDEDLKILPAGMTAPDQAAYKWLDLKGKEPVGHPILLPKDGYYQIIQWVKQLGDLKAKDGIRQFIGKAVEDGELGEEGKRLLEALNSSPIKKSVRETINQTNTLIAMIVDSRVLLKMAKALEDSDAY